MLHISEAAMKRRSLNEGNLSFFLSYSSLLLPRDSSGEKKNLSTIILIYSLALHPDLVHTGFQRGYLKGQKSFSDPASMLDISEQGTPLFVLTYAVRE